MYWAFQDWTGLHWDWIGWGGHWSGGLGAPVIQVIQVVQLVQLVQLVQVVQLVRMISIDDMHSENTYVVWSKSSNYRERGDVMPVTGKRTDGRNMEKRAVFW